MQTTGVGGLSETTNEQGMLPGYQNVWLNRSGIANILSLANISNKFKCTYDSTMKYGF